MLTEAVLGPLWAWLFINETPPLVVLVGGTIVLSAVLLQFFNRKIFNAINHKIKMSSSQSWAGYFRVIN